MRVIALVLAVLVLGGCKAEFSHTPDAGFKSMCEEKKGALIKVTGGLWACKLPDGTEIKG